MITLFEDYFTNVYHLTGIYIQGKENVNTIESLYKGDSDIIHIDSASAILGYTLYGLQGIAIEQTNNPVNNEQYYTTAILRSGSSYKTLADLKSIRSCHAGYINAAGTINLALYDSSSISFIDNNHNLLSCTSPLTEGLLSFFDHGSCIPSDSITNEAICDLCHDDYQSCTSNNNHKGALKALSQGICNVAFIRSIHGLDIVIILVMNHGVYQQINI